MKAEFLLTDGIEPVPVKVALLLDLVLVGMDDELSEFVQEEGLAPHQVFIHLVVQGCEAEFSENEASLGERAAQNDCDRTCVRGNEGA